MNSPLSFPYSEQDRDEVRSELARIALSPVFINSPSAQRLLQFLVSRELAGESTSLKESYIGHAHYGREPGYDTKNDALVRVNIRRLRTLLDAYYTQQTTGTLRIHLPKGSYVPRYHPTALHNFVTTAPETEKNPLPLEATSQTPQTLMEEAEPPKLPVVERRAKSRLHLHAAAVAVATVLLALTFVSLFRKKASASVAQPAWTARPFRRPGGLAVFPDWSPNGKQVAFVLSPDPHSQRNDIVLEDVQTQSLTRIDTNGSAGTRPAWSPDGSRLAYLRVAGQTTELMVLSLRDHSQRRVALLSGSYPWLCEIPRLSWTMDERHIITADRSNTVDTCHIVSIDLITGTRQELTQSAPGVLADVEPAVSPDGEHIAFLRNTGTLVGDLYDMKLDGSALRRVTWERRDIMGFCWQADSLGFILASRRQDGVLRLWQTGQDGTFTRLTDGLTSVGFPALSPDGSAILFASYHNSSSIWKVFADGKAPEQLVANNSVNADPRFSPDGRKIAYRSDLSGAHEIWIADADGRQAQQLTTLNGPFVDHIAWSPDSRQIAFDCRDSDHTQICLMPVQGGTMTHPVPWNSEEEMPIFSRDGKSLFFTSQRSGDPEIYNLPLQTSHPEILPVARGVRAAELSDKPSPNKPLLLSASFLPVNGIYAQTVGSAGSSHAASAAPTLMLSLDQDRLRNAWDTAPGGFWYVGNQLKEGYPVIYRYSLADHSSTPLFTFRHPLVGGDVSLSVNADGRSALLVEQGTETSDLYVLRKPASR